MKFYEELLEATRAEREELLNLPLIRAGAAGRVTREDYIAFLTQAYHHVKFTVPLLMLCDACLPERLAWLHEGMASYIREEAGHEEWVLNDIKACGGDAESVRYGVPAPATKNMIVYAFDVIIRVNPVGFFGMVLVLEGASVQLASQAAHAIQQSLKLPDSAFTYLTSHGALDQGHTAFYESLVNRLDDANDRAVLIDCAKAFYKLYGDIFRTLERQRSLVTES